ncbi:hypothetical protein E0L16_21450 [Enterobacter quasihormaechei]|uniref:Uncharacterized protein n=1 Tax=Enterobacter quasihormaechei TaxID=2529382 RepID=A0AAE8U9P1_9ENTR|nr:hypothetical protein E0L16_21450 [Enterobacter quasihormaechei]
MTICPHNAFHLHLSGLTSGREGAAPQALALPPRQPEGMTGFSRANRRRLCPARIIYFPSP